MLSSFLGLFLDQQLNQPLLHYDYERGKGGGYPEAHLQVCAHTATWNSICERRDIGSRPLERLHLPVGGRRYRPTVEDVLDFVIREDLADSHPQAGAYIDAGRQRFHELQLRAAVRRNPAAAVEVLRDMGKV
ncbi:MAG TPA: hypothetical protein VGJ95_00310 [Pseudonocardiaceae bacterium]